MSESAEQCKKLDAEQLIGALFLHREGSKESWLLFDRVVSSEMLDKEARLGNTALASKLDISALCSKVR